MPHGFCIRRLNMPRFKYRYQEILLVKVPRAQIAQNIGLLRSILCACLQPLLEVQAEQRKQILCRQWFVTCSWAKKDEGPVLLLHWKQEASKMTTQRVSLRNILTCKQTLLPRCE